CGPASSTCHIKIEPKARPRQMDWVQPRRRDQWSSCESLSPPGLLDEGDPSIHRHFARGSLRILLFVIGTAGALSSNKRQTLAANGGHRAPNGGFAAAQGNRRSTNERSLIRRP